MLDSIAESHIPVMDFALQIHKVDTLVSYKNDEWDDEE
jgi:hypothetical protein